MQFKRRVSILVLCIFLFNTLLQGPFSLNSVFASQTKETTKHKKEEILKDRTKWTKTFDNGDGTKTLQIYSSPVHYKDKNEWKEKKYGFKKSQKGYVNEENEFKTSFKDKDLKTSLYSMEVDGNSISYTAVNGSSFGSNYYDSFKEVTPKTTENQVLYKGIFDNVDIRNTVVGDGIKEDIIINKYTGKNAFAFKLNVKGLIPEKQEDGSIVFYKENAIDSVEDSLEKNEENDKKDNKEDIAAPEVKSETGEEIESETSNIAFVIPKPYMVDSNINKESGDSARSEDVSYELVEEGNEMYLCVVADDSWLSSPERKYPIYIDPSTNTTVSGDAYVSSAYPANNYANDWNATDGYYQLKVGYYDSTTGTNDSYMKFYTSAINGKMINSATLNVSCAHSYLTTANGVWIDTVNSAWDDKTITWNNKPASTGYKSTTAVRGQWMSVDVKDIVSKWASSPAKAANNGFRLHANGNGQTFWKKFRSSGNANANPYLAVTYTEVPTPTGSTFAYPDNMYEGYVNLSWPAVTGASQYKVGLYNGKEYEWFDAGASTSWTTKGKKIWPTESEAASGIYKLHFDNNGSELVQDPTKVYDNAGGQYAGKDIKQYAFRLKALNSIGETIESEAYVGVMPKTIPNTPTGEAIANSRPAGTGHINLGWKPVIGATGYKVGIFNGKDYEWFDAGNSTSWSTKGKGIWPTESEIASGGYKLHFDGNGSELPVNPTKTYDNSKGAYAGQNIKIYALRVVSYNDKGESGWSGAFVKEIPASTTVSETNETFLGEEEFYASRENDVSYGESSVNLINQNLYLNFNDLNIEGRGIDLGLNRYYNSQDDNVYILGKGWKFDFEQSVKELPLGNVLYTDEDGSRHEFFKTSSGYEADKGIFLDLTKNPNGEYIITTRDKTKYNFNSSGKLVFIEDANSNKLSINYDGQGKILNVTDAVDRKLNFSYDTANNKVIVTDPSGRKVTYTVTQNGLTGVKHIDASGGEVKSSSVTYESDGSMTITKDIGETRKSSGENAKTQVNYKLNAGKLTSYTKTVGIRVEGSTNLTNKSVTTTFSDEAGYKKVVTNPSDRTEKYKLDLEGKLLEEIKSGVRVLGASQEIRSTYTYNDNKDIISKVDSRGETTTFAYDNKARLTSQKISFIGNQGSSLMKLYSYEDSNNEYKITKIEEKELLNSGSYNEDMTRVTNYSYDSRGNILEEKKALDPKDENGSVMRKDRYTKYTYDTLGNVRTKTEGGTNTLDRKTTYTYDASQLYILEEENPLGQETKYEYNPLTGYTISETQYNSTKKLYEYYPFGETKKEETQYKDGEQNLKKEWKDYDYNKGGYLLEEKINGSRVTSYQYDTEGSKVYSHDGVVGNYSYYNELGENISSIDSKGNKTINTYDSIGNLITLKISNSDTLKETTYYTYDESGNKILEKNDREGYVTEVRYSYDGFNRLIKESNPSVSNDVKTTTYNIFSEITSTEEKLEDNKTYKQSFKYDKGGNEIYVADNSDPQVEKWSVYDAIGNKIEEKQKINGEFASTLFIYDKIDRIIDVKYPMGIRTVYDYKDNENKKITKTNDGNDNITVENFDGLGRVYKKEYQKYNVILPNETIKDENFTYNDFSEVLTEKIEDNVSNQSNLKRFTYDTFGRVLSEVSIKNGEENKKIEKRYTYNLVGEATNVWQGDYTDPENPIIEEKDLIFDEDSRITNEVQTINQNSTITNTKEYDDSNNSVNISNESGNTNISYSKSQYIDKVSNGNIKGNNTYFDNNLIKQEVKLGSKTLYDYNGDKIKSIQINNATTGNSIKRIDYNHNESGKVARASEGYGVAGNLIKNYTYNKDGRLINYTDSSNNIKYEFDNFTGNVKKEIKNGITLDYKYEKDNRLTQIKKDNVEVSTFSYEDANGNLTKSIKNGEIVTYSYNGDDKLYNVVKDGKNIVIGYGESGNILIKKVDNNETKYYYDSDSLVKEVKPDGTELNYIKDEAGTLIGLRVVINGETLEYNYEFNARGDIIGLTNTTGKLIGEYFYDPYGKSEVLPSSDTSNNDKKVLEINPYRYVGQHGVYYDTDLDFYLMGYRYYDAEIHRFISPDVFEGDEENPISKNKYLYCEGDPVNNIDPSGMVSMSFGTKVHKIIQAYFKAIEPMRGQIEYYIPKYVSGNKSGAGWADIVLKLKGKTEVYEIKSGSYSTPRSYYNKQGKDQLTSYINAMKRLKKDPNPVRGTSFNPNGILLPHPTNRKKEIKLYTYYGRDPGMIYYNEYQGDRSDKGKYLKTAGVAAAGAGAGYLVYRGVRLIPSLLPPFWWTLPGNLVMP